MCFAQKGFQLTGGTKFKHEPLKSLVIDKFPDGLFFAAQTKLPSDCAGEKFCNFSVTLMGNGSLLKFHGNVGTTQVKVTADVYDRPIKDALKFNKVEMFIKVKRCLFTMCSRSVSSILISDQLQREAWLSLLVSPRRLSFHLS